MIKEILLFIHPVAQRSKIPCFKSSLNELVFVQSVNQISPDAVRDKPSMMTPLPCTIFCYPVVVLKFFMMLVLFLTVIGTRKS